MWYVYRFMFPIASKEEIDFYRKNYKREKTLLLNHRKSWKVALNIPL